MSLAFRYIIALIVIVLDQITKIAADRSLILHDPVAITSFFNINLAYNRGAAFSFLSNAGGWQRWLFTGISLVVSIVLIVWLYRMSKRERWLSVAIALILGGAVGNLIDRSLYGHVIDFIQVYYNTWYFPSFNIADAAISCGTVLLLALTIFEGREDNTATS